MITDKGAQVGAVLKRACTFHEKTQKYDDVDHPETAAFTSEDEVAINRIINSVGFILK